MGRLRRHLLRSIVGLRPAGGRKVRHAASLSRARGHRPVLSDEERDTADHGCGVREAERQDDGEESEHDGGADGAGARILRDALADLFRDRDHAEHFRSGFRSLAGGKVVRREGVSGGRVHDRDVRRGSPAGADSDERRAGAGDESRESQLDERGRIQSGALHGSRRDIAGVDSDGQSSRPVHPLGAGPVGGIHCWGRVQEAGYIGAAITGSLRAAGVVGSLRGCRVQAPASGTAF